MAHLAVTHLPVRQPNKMVRSLDKRVGVLPKQLVIRGLPSQCNSVIRSFSAITPSVENGQYQGMLVNRHEEDTSIFNLIFFLRINCREGRLMCLVSRRPLKSPERICHYTMPNHPQICHPERSAAKSKDLRLLFRLSFP